MIYTGLNRTGEIETVKANGGADVAEVYGGINEANPIYYKTRTITGQTPLSYKALSKPLSDYLISGNAVQYGTPTPSDPVDVVGCGVWDETHQSYKLPPTVNSTEYPIYLGQVPTTRMIRKLVLTGGEAWTTVSDIYYALSITPYVLDRNYLLSTHFFVGNYSGALAIGQLRGGGTPSSTILFNYDNGVIGAESFKSYLAAQYANGTPVTVWYVLATPETGIVNEPLMKIGDYADTVSMAQAGVTIPTTAGTNQLTVGTTVQPSEVSITGNIKEVQGT